MILKSEVTGKEYEVKTYVSSYGGCGIDHSSLQDILENQLNVNYQINVLTASASYCAVECKIDDPVLMRCVSGFSDINTKLLDGMEARNIDFAKKHPLLMAVNSAMDAAIRAFLKWERCYPEELADPCPEKTDTESEVTEQEISKTEEPENDFPGMNPPEDPEPEKTKEEEISDKAARLMELGQMCAPKGTKHANLTLNEIWDKDKSWINFICNKNKLEKYNYVREYASLRNELDS